MQPDTAWNISSWQSVPKQPNYSCTLALHAGNTTLRRHVSLKRRAIAEQRADVVTYNGEVFPPGSWALWEGPARDGMPPHRSPSKAGRETTGTKCSQGHPAGPLRFCRITLSVTGR